MPVSLALLLQIFPRTQRGLAAGLFGALTSLAAALGPVVGGYIIGHWNWRWIFYINVPLAVLGFVATWLLVPRRGHRSTETALDYVGIGLVTAGLFCLTLAIIQANEWGWTSLRDLGLLAVAAVTLTGFTFWELAVPTPMLELRLFRRRTFAAANVAVATVDIAMMGAAFLLVIFLVGVLDWTELRAAFAITPMPLTGLLSGAVRRPPGRPRWARGRW